MNAFDQPQHVTFGGNDRGVHIAVVNEGQVRAANAVHGHLAPVGQVAWSPEGKLLASGDLEGEAWIQRTQDQLERESTL